MGVTALSVTIESCLLVIEREDLTQTFLEVVEESWKKKISGLVPIASLLAPCVKNRETRNEVLFRLK